MSEFNKNTGWVIISFIIGTLIGTGSIWQWKDLQLSQRKQEIEEVLKIAEIRKQVGGLQQEIIVMTDEYVTLLNAYRNRPDPSTNNRIIQLRARLKVIKDDFFNLEASLSQLEGRAARVIQIDFVPPAPPMGLRIE